ncbi:hypothetical protein Tco_0597632 [Tanacetum coccineum]
METKDSLSSCSDSREKEIQQMQKKAQILKESSINSLKSNVREVREDFKEYTRMEAQSFRDLIQNLDFIEKCITERQLYDHKTKMKLYEKKLQMQECKDTLVQAFDANLVVKQSNDTESAKQPNELTNSLIYKENSGTTSGT